MPAFHLDRGCARVLVEVSMRQARLSAALTLWRCTLTLYMAASPLLVLPRREGVQEAAREDEGYFIRSGIVVVLRNQTIPRWGQCCAGGGWLAWYPGHNNARGQHGGAASCGALLRKPGRRVLGCAHVYKSRSLACPVL